MQKQTPSKKGIIRELESDILNDKGQLIRLIDLLLTHLLAETKGLTHVKTIYDCKEVPTISISDYMKRICKYAHCSGSVYVVALIYIDRFQERVQNFIINYFNIHRLLISSIMVAAKFLDDFYYKNQFYAKIGGITKKDINSLELELMETLEFSVFISNQEFQNYIQRLLGYKEMQQ